MSCRMASQAARKLPRVLEAFLNKHLVIYTRFQNHVTGSKIE